MPCYMQCENRFFFSSRRRHTRYWRDWSSDVCSSDLSALNLGIYEPVSARVYERSPSTWYSTVVINKGSSDGVKKDQPVLNGAGLVGRVKSVSSGSAVVTLLTDQDFGVSAVTAKSREPGTVAPAVGGDLLFDLVPRGRIVRTGDRIVTAGTTNPRLPSPFPRGILIGTVRRIDEGDGEDRKSTRLNSSHANISYAVFCLKKKDCPTYNRTN